MFCAETLIDRIHCQVSRGVLCISALLAQLLVFGVNALAQEIESNAPASSPQVSTANDAHPPTVIINGLAKRVISFTPPALNSAALALPNTRISPSGHDSSSSPVGSAIENMVEQVARAGLIENSTRFIPSPRSSRVVELNAPIEEVAVAPHLPSFAAPSATAGFNAGSGLTQVSSLNPPAELSLPIESWASPSALVARARESLTLYRQDFESPNTDSSSGSTLHEGSSAASDWPARELSEDAERADTLGLPWPSARSSRVVSVPPPPAISNIPSLAATAPHSRVDEARERDVNAGEIKLPMLRYPMHSELTLVEAIQAAVHFSPEIAILRTKVGFGNTGSDDTVPPVSMAGSLKLAQELGILDSHPQPFNSRSLASVQVAIEFQQPLPRASGMQVNTRLSHRIAISDSAIAEEFSACLQAHLGQVVTAYSDLVARRNEYARCKFSSSRTEATAKESADQGPWVVVPAPATSIDTITAVQPAAALRAEYAVVMAQEQLLHQIFGQWFKHSVDHEVIPTSDMSGPVCDLQIFIASPLAP